MRVWRQGAAAARKAQAPLLGLRLRGEFESGDVSGARLAMVCEHQPGATQLGADEFFQQTYPTSDLLAGLQYFMAGKSRPLAIVGDAWKGKSHLLATLHHALSAPEATRRWMQNWSTRLDEPRLAEIELPEGFTPITKSMYRARVPALWDVVFDWHQQGGRARAEWRNADDSDALPPDSLLVTLFENCPTALLLDDLQTWLDGRASESDAQNHELALRFLESLSRIATERPDVLLLAVSLGQPEAELRERLQVDGFHIHALDDCKDHATSAVQRMFENRHTIEETSLQSLLRPYLTVCTERETRDDETAQDLERACSVAWPFAPDLLDAIGATAARASDPPPMRVCMETFANLWMRASAATRIFTAADIDPFDETCKVVALWTATNPDQARTLTEKLASNVDTVTSSEALSKHNREHARRLLRALWVRSLLDPDGTGTPLSLLRTDLAGSDTVDDDAFEELVEALRTNALNVRFDGDRVLLTVEDNPAVKVAHEASTPGRFDDETIATELAHQVGRVIGSLQEVRNLYRVIVLPKAWEADPWSAVDEGDRPAYWDGRITLVVLPEVPDPLEARLGRWLKVHVPQQRNTVRFLLPRLDGANLYRDPSLGKLVQRLLVALEWANDDPAYETLAQELQGRLRNILRQRFDRFAILDIWNEADPTACRFHVIEHMARGARIPQAVDSYVRDNLFDPVRLENALLEFAANNATVALLLEALREPQPNAESCIPWLDQKTVVEGIARCCAKGSLVIGDAEDEELLPREGEDETAAWQRICQRLTDKPGLDHMHVQLPRRAVDEAAEIVSAEPEEPVEAPEAADSDAVEAEYVDGPGHDETEFFYEAAGDYVEIAEDEHDGFEPLEEIDVDGPDGAQVSDETQDENGPLASNQLFAAEPGPPTLLLDQLQRWGIAGEAPLQRVHLKIKKLSAQDLQKLLAELPSDLVCDLMFQSGDDDPD